MPKNDKTKDDEVQQNPDDPNTEAEQTSGGADGTDGQGEGADGGASDGYDSAITDDGSPRSMSAEDAPVESRAEARRESRKNLNQIVKEAPSKNDPVDVRTNQPISDFAIQGLKGEDKKAVELLQENITAGNGEGRLAASQNLLEARAANAEAQAANEQIAKDVEAQTRQMIKDMPMMDPAAYRARMQAQVAAEAAANTQNTVVPGGRYQVGRNIVDAHGNILERVK